MAIPKNHRTLTFDLTDQLVYKGGRLWNPGGKLDDNGDDPDIRDAFTCIDLMLAKSANFPDYVGATPDGKKAAKAAGKKKAPSKKTKSSKASKTTKTTKSSKAPPKKSTGGAKTTKSSSQKTPGRGDRVKVKVLGDWYPGKVTAVRKDGLAIAFDDGDKATYPVEEVRPA